MRPTITQIDADRIDDVEDLWLALHRHHKRVSALQPLVESEDLSWARRRETYLAWLQKDEALALLAEDAGRAIGYAVAHLIAGPDDTWPVGEQWAEIYSLSVAAGARGAGVGTTMLDALEVELAGRGIHDLAVAVQVGNDAAQRLYENRGMRAGETLLYRFGSRA